MGTSRQRWPAGRSASKSYDQLRVSVQLAEVPGGTVRWSQTTVVRLGDIFQLQDALTSRIVESLSVPLTARDKQTLVRDVPASAKAYEFYLRGRQFFEFRRKSLEYARQMFKRAIELDPNHAKAHNNLANALRSAGAAEGPHPSRVGAAARGRERADDGAGAPRQDGSAEARPA